MQDMETIGLPDYGINTAAAHGPRIRGYTVEQMRAYGDARAKAEREACAKVCEARYMGDNNREDMEARRCATAIRNRAD